VSNDTDVSKDHTVFSFRVKQSSNILLGLLDLEEGAVTFRNICNYLPTDRPVQERVFDPEDEGAMMFRNVSNYLPTDTPVQEVVNCLTLKIKAL
jgi:hypothetical protein